MQLMLGGLGRIWSATLIQGLSSLDVGGEAGLKGKILYE